MRCSGGTRRAHQVHGTSSIHPSISHILQGRKLLHSPPADTAMRQTTTAMAAQWHPSQHAQRALLISSKRGSFPCREEGGPTLINPALPGSACRGIGENAPSRVLVPSLTLVRCAKGVTRQRTAPVSPPTLHSGLPSMATLGHLIQEGPTIHDTSVPNKD